MRIWLDLANSPHPLLFAPIARHLEDRGHEIVATARDNAQTAGLARERWPDVEVVGAASPPGRAPKLRAIARRALNLRRWASARPIDLAVSHNSYAQIVAARSLRIPVATAMDFEYQPANHLAFRLATRVIVPEALDPSVLRRQGATARKLVRFPGLKEELYIGDFDPDPAALARLGIDCIPQKLAIVRTPPTGALYHPTRNPLFDEAAPHDLLAGRRAVRRPAKEPWAIGRDRRAEPGQLRCAAAAGRCPLAPSTWPTRWSEQEGR